MIKTHKSFPSIYTWVIYNEGWGQLDSAPEIELTPMVRSLDPTRLIDSVTGWNDHGAGDYSDNHHVGPPSWVNADWLTRPISTLRRSAVRHSTRPPRAHTTPPESVSKASSAVSGITSPSSSTYSPCPLPSPPPLPFPHLPLFSWIGRADGRLAFGTSKRRSTPSITPTS